jgi:hypothetical protein
MVEGAGDVSGFLADPASGGRYLIAIPRCERVCCTYTSGNIGATLNACRQQILAAEAASSQVKSDIGQAMLTSQTSLDLT